MKKKIENSYDNDADFFYSSTQQQDFVGRDHDRRETTDVVSNYFQQKLQGKKRIIIIRAKDDKKIFGNPSICQKILGDSIFGEMKFEEIK